MALLAESGHKVDPKRQTMQSKQDNVSCCELPQRERLLMRKALILTLRSES